MANRLTQIATRTGDDGTTGLGDNTRVSKNASRVRAMGDVDELNSHIGVLLCEQMPAEVRELLVDIQHQLFNLGGVSCRSPASICSKTMRCCNWTTRWRTTTPICPACKSSSCQRATGLLLWRMCAARWLGGRSGLWWRWAMKMRSGSAPRQYLNRLSDLMFVLARVLNRMDGGDDVYWKSARLAGSAE
jgi:cob(I)alamin adenosyltransferase